MLETLHIPLKMSVSFVLHQTHSLSVKSDLVKQNNDGCGTLSQQTCQQKTRVRHKLFCSFNPELLMVKELMARLRECAVGRGGGGVRWICFPLLLQCYDQSNEICGELGLSFCCITHTLACTTNPLWACPQTHPLRRMDAFADVSDNRASFSAFFMVYI